MSEPKKEMSASATPFIPRSRTSAAASAPTPTPAKATASTGFKVTHTARTSAAPPVTAGLQGKVSPAMAPRPSPTTPKPTALSAATGNNNNKELSAAAAPFVPNRAIPATKSLPPSDSPFLSSWRLSYLPQLRDGDTYDPRDVYKIEKISTFWHVFNNLPDAGKLPEMSNLYLFREGIVPRWEHEKNAKGGIYRIVVPLPEEPTKDQETLAHAIWLRTLAKAVGEQWNHKYKVDRNKVNGVICKNRGPPGPTAAVIIEVWVEEMMDGVIEDILDECEDLEVPLGEIKSKSCHFTHASRQNKEKQTSNNSKKKNKRY